MLIVRIRRVFVVLVYNLHYEGDECLDEDFPALRKVAPLFEQIDQFLSQVTFTVVVLEKREQHGCNLW